MKSFVFSFFEIEIKIITRYVSGICQQWSWRNVRAIRDLLTTIVIVRASAFLLRWLEFFRFPRNSADSSSLSDPSNCLLIRDF